jgi:broad specificity phosphatase PhoE
VENPRGVLYGHLEGFPLSAAGRRRASLLAASLRESGIRRIVSSPLERAFETATCIAQELGISVETDPLLREAEFSRYLQGVRYWQVPLRRPRWYVHKFVRRGLWRDDESIDDLGGRVLAVARRLALESPEAPSAVVSHADPIQAAWVILDGRPRNELEMNRKRVDRAGYLRVEYEGERVVSWEYVPPPKLESSPRLNGSAH